MKMSVKQWKELHPPVNCHSCGAEPGEQHRDFCTIERCSVCHLQLFSVCECSIDQRHHDPEKTKWTGWHPHELIAVEHNWWSRWNSQTERHERCEFSPDADWPDLNRVEAVARGWVYNPSVLEKLKKG